MKILIAVTNTPTYGEKDAATGLWLGEAAEFVDEVSKRGFEMDYVSPKGGFAPLDPRSMKKAALACTLRPEEVDADRYDALYYTGGHGVMWDFPSSEGLARIGLAIYGQGGYLASVCHGIAGLLYLQKDGEYLVAGKNITGFTTMEEYLSGHSGDIPFWNERVAKAHGAVFRKKRPFASFAIQDGRIVTGQNPESPRAVARLLLENIG